MLHENTITLDDLQTLTAAQAFIMQPCPNTTFRFNFYCAPRLRWMSTQYTYMQMDTRACLICITSPTYFAKIAARLLLGFTSCMQEQFRHTLLLATHVLISVTKTVQMAPSVFGYKWLRLVTWFHKAIWRPNVDQLPNNSLDTMSKENAIMYDLTCNILYVLKYWTFSRLLILN